MIARICQATTPQQPKTEEIHFSIKRMFKLYFKSNLCMLIHFPFCFAFHDETRFFCVHQMPLKALILHSFAFPPKSVDVFASFHSRRQKQKANTLLRWIFCCVGCSVYCLRSVANGDSKKCFLFFSLPFLRRRREKKLCHVLILPLF